MALVNVAVVVELGRVVVDVGCVTVVVDVIDVGCVVVNMGCVDDDDKRVEKGGRVPRHCRLLGRLFLNNPVTVRDDSNSHDRVRWSFSNASVNAKEIGTFNSFEPEARRGGQWPGQHEGQRVGVNAAGQCEDQRSWSTRGSAWLANMRVNADGRHGG